MHKTIEPRVSGDAYVRKLSYEVSWVHGSLEDFKHDSHPKFRSVVSPLGWQWQKNWNLNAEDTPFILLLSELVTFLKECLKGANYEHSYIEWKWDGKDFFLQSISPAPQDYKWLRYISSAGIEAALPERMNKLTEHILRKTSPKISQIFSLWDSAVDEENEPYLVVYEDSFYANTDLIFSRIKNLGISSKQYSETLGNEAPYIKSKLARFIKNFPVRIKMNSVSKEVVAQIPNKLDVFNSKLEKILKEKCSISAGEFEGKLLNFLERYFLFLVQRNILLNICISGSKFEFPSLAFHVLGVLDKDVTESDTYLNAKPDASGRFGESGKELEKGSIDFLRKIREELIGINPAYFESYPLVRNKAGTFPENLDSN